jgi:hypothetical protein
VSLDLHALSVKVEADGKKGKNWKYAAWGLKSGGILSGVTGTAFGILALANIWNPGGWVIGGIAVLGTLLTWLGGKSRKKAEKKRLEARSRALADVREGINEAYDKLEHDNLDHLDAACEDAVYKLLEYGVSQAVNIRHLLNQAGNLERLASELLYKVPPSKNNQDLLWNVARAQEINAFQGRAGAQGLHSFGEDWIDDPDGLKSPRGKSYPLRTSCYDPGIFQRIFEGIQRNFKLITEGVKPGMGRNWLVRVLNECQEDIEALAMFDNLKGLAKDGRPRFHFVGDYSSGKSSFIKRLFMDAGLVVPKSLRVGGGPTTDTSQEYEYDGIILVDTPGFQSLREEQSREAFRSFPDTSVVMLILQPNLLIGDCNPILRVLAGDQEDGFLPKLDRTFFIINRADELGVDPESDPQQYVDLVKRKQMELVQAFSARGISVAPERIFCMASDPYGLVGDRRDASSAAFDPYRNWDGFFPFMKELRKSKAYLESAGIERSILEGGVARLGRLNNAVEERLHKLTQRRNSIEGLLMRANKAFNEGEGLIKKYTGRLERIVRDEAGEHTRALLNAGNAEMLNQAISEIAHWLEDPSFQGQLNRLEKEAIEEFDSWRKRSQDEINRRLESHEFKLSFPEQSGRGIGIRVDEGNFIRSAKNVTGQASTVLKGATHDTVYSIGKSLGQKFKPWGATKLAARLAKVGVVLQIVATILDTVVWWKDEKHIKELENNRKEAVGKMQNLAEEVIKLISYGDSEVPQDLGLIQQFRLMLVAFREEAATLEKEKSELVEWIEKEEMKKAKYLRLRKEAEELVSATGRA